MPFFSRAIAHLKIIANAILRHNRWQVQRFTFSPSPLRRIKDAVALLKIYHARRMDTENWTSGVTVSPKPVSAIIQKWTRALIKGSALNSPLRLSSHCRVFDKRSRNNHASAVQVCRVRLQYTYARHDNDIRCNVATIIDAMLSIEERLTERYWEIISDSLKNPAWRIGIRRMQEGVLACCTIYRSDIDDALLSENRSTLDKSSTNLTLHVQSNKSFFLNIIMTACE